MRSVTSDFKTTIRNNAVYSDGYVVIKDGASFNRTYTSDELNLIEIMNDIFKNDTYVGEIGQSALKLNLLGDNVGLLPLNKELTIEVYLGIKVGVSYEYVRYQDFILLEAKYNETTNFTEILATDKLLFLNQDFTDTNTYPMTLGNYVESVVVACGLQLENKTWLNNGFILDSQPFNDVYNAREIIAKASELAMSFVVINPTTNKVDFRNFYTKITTNAFDEELDEDEYYKLKLRDNNLGSNGVNTLVLRLSQVEGENNTVVNATNVGIDGNIEVVISDNDFINTEAKRLSIINSMFTRIDTLKYQPLELEYRGFPYLELGDVIKVKSPTNHRKLELYSHLSLEDFTHLQLEGRDLYIPILEMTIRYNGGLFGTIGAEPLINTETKYRNVNTAEQRARSAEIKVDKVAGEISALVSDVGNLEGQVSSNTAQLIIQAGQIATKVEQSTFNALGNRVTTAESNITQTANNITLAVETAVGGQDSILPYTQGTWEVGAITGDGSLVADSTFIRTNNFFTILPSTDYVLQCSGALDFSNTVIFFFNSSNVVVGSSGFTGGDLKITTPSTAVKFRVRARKQGGGVFPLSEMPNHWVRVVPVGKFLKGSKFEINGEKIISQADGIEFQNASGTPVVFFDTVNNRFVFRGQVEASSGLIGRFAISGQDLVFTSELFNKDYDRSDVIKLHRILLGFEPQTAYDLTVYDFDNSGTLDITDLVILQRHVSLGDPLPTPHKRIRSVVRIGTNNGALTTQAVAEDGSLGPTTTIRGEKITGDLINTNALSTRTMSLNGNTISGGIEASGSNSNGHWIRYSDGTQICWNGFVSTYNNSTGTGVIDLPASFINDLYSVTVNARGIASGGLGGSFVAEYRLVDTSSFIIKLLVHTPTTIVEAANGTLASYQAIGRWK